MKNIDSGLFETNKSMILSLERERKISFNIVKIQVVEQPIEQEVTPSTSSNKRGRKSKSKKGD